MKKKPSEQLSDENKKVWRKQGKRVKRQKMRSRKKVLGKRKAPKE